LTEAKRPLIKVTGRVIRTDERGMAICFDNNHRFAALAGAGAIS
jgi:hypothetical protein